MMLYRPFLHYISPRTVTGQVDERYYACAAAGISVSRNIIHIAREIKNQALVVGPFWSMLYTEFFAVLTLVFYVLESPEKQGSMEIFADAACGREMITKLAGRSVAADRISKSMDTLWENLPASIKNNKTRPTTSKKRSASGLNLGPMPLPNKKAPAKNGKAAARKSINQRSSFEDFHRTPSQRAISTDYPELQSLDIPSTSPTSNLAPTPSTAHSSASAYIRTSSQTQESHGMYKLDALMFPSGDPFAYPNQPIDYMSAATHAASQPALMANAHATAQHATDSRNYYIPGMYGDIEGQLSEFSHPGRSGGIRSDHPVVVPPYMLQSSPIQNGLGLSAQMYQTPNALAMQHAQAQQHQHRQQHAHHQHRGGREMDDIMADSGFNRTWDIFGGAFKPL